MLPICDTQTLLLTGNKLFIKIRVLYETSIKSVKSQRVIFALKKFSCTNLTCTNLSSMQQFIERVEELSKICNLKEKRRPRKFKSIPLKRVCTALLTLLRYYYMYYIYSNFAP